MCTVTIIPIRHSPAAIFRQSGSDIATDNGFRLACNRDESRQRPPALLPEVRTYGTRRAIMPIDPVSDGTWIAVNDTGLALTLLNVYQPAKHSDASVSPAHPNDAAPGTGIPARSRGAIIPALLHLRSVAEVAAMIESVIDPAQFPPFRVAAVDQQTAIDAHGDGRRLSIRTIAGVIEPLLFTSSGLGDHIVEGPRRALFDEFFQPGRDWSAEQEAFHRHSWPDRRDISVCMSREKARTVSYTLVEVTSEMVTLRYHSESPDTAAHDSSLSLPRTECSA